MPNSDTERSLGFLLHDVSRLWRKKFDNRAHSLGLTRAQWAVIAHLYRNEGINQTALADVLEVENVTLARLLDRLEAAGWVERRPHPGDRRAKRLYLTEKAFPILERMRLLAADVREQALAGVLPAEREALIDMLEVIKRNLCAAEPPADQETGHAAEAPLP